MTYSKTTWVDGEVRVDANRLNNMEDGIERAHLEPPKLKGEIDKTNEKITDASIDFNGKQHLSLKTRLQNDLGDIHNKINNATLMEFSYSNVTINHSYAGYTKDMKIEGATYQNLVNASNYEITGNINVTKIPGGFKSIVTESVDRALGVMYFVGRDNCLFKQNTKYTIIYDLDYSSISKIPLFYFSGGGNISLSKNKGKNIIVVDIGERPVDRETRFIFYNDERETNNWIQITNFIVLEGDYTNKPIPQYFEGIKSVGEDEENKISILSCNKNLLDINKTFGANKQVYTTTNTGFIQKGSRSYVPLKYSTLKPNTSYVISGKATGENVQGFRIEVRQNAVKFADSNALNNEMKIFTIPSVINETLELMIWASKTMTANPNDLDNCGVDNVQLEEGDHATTYVTHKSDKKDILLPSPLRGLQNGGKDTIEFINNEWCYVQRVYKKVLNGSEIYYLNDDTKEKTIRFHINLELKNVKNNVDDSILSDRFASFNQTKRNEDIELISSDGWNKAVHIQILKSKLSTEDVEGFKAWLQANPVTVYYELETPIITPLENIDQLNLQTFDERTHINSLNAIPANLVFKAPINVTATITDLKNENNQLKKELYITNERNLELNSEILQVQDFALDIDFRACITEMDIIDLKAHMGLE